jgi:hypothetical protein
MFILQDYNTMFLFFMKVHILTHTLPVFIGWLVIIILLSIGLTDASTFKAILALFSIFQVFLGLYGWYRIVKSQIYAYHVAVMRDSVCLVFDGHLDTRFPMLAAIHIFDQCIFVSKQEDKVRTSQCANVTDDL